MQAINRTLSHSLHGKSFGTIGEFLGMQESIIDGRPSIESKQGAQYQSVQNGIFVFLMMTAFGWSIDWKTS